MLGPVAHPALLRGLLELARRRLTHLVRHGPYLEGEERCPLIETGAKGANVEDLAVRGRGQAVKRAEAPALTSITEPVM